MAIQRILFFIVQHSGLLDFARFFINFIWETAKKNTVLLRLI